MNSPTEGKNNGGGGGKEIDSNEEEGNLSGTNKQQINIGEAEKPNEPTKMSGSELVKTDSEDSRNPPPDCPCERLAFSCDCEED